MQKGWLQSRSETRKYNQLLEQQGEATWRFASQLGLTIQPDRLESWRSGKRLLGGRGLRAKPEQNYCKFSD